MVLHSTEDFSRLYERKSSWTLQEDSNLINQLNAITKHMLDSMRTFDDETWNLHRDAELLGLRIDNIHNNIHLLKATKLVEETITESPPPLEQRDEKPRVGAEERTTSAIKNALVKCFRFVDENFKQFRQVEASRLEFGDLYPNRRLPPIIGSAEFHADVSFGVTGAEPSALPTPILTRSLVDDKELGRLTEFDAISNKLDNSLSSRSDTDQRLPSAQSLIVGRQRAAPAADNSGSLTSSGQSLRQSPSSSHRSSDDKPVEASSDIGPSSSGQFQDSLAAVLRSRATGDGVHSLPLISSKSTNFAPGSRSITDSDKSLLRPTVLGDAPTKRVTSAIVTRESIDREATPTATKSHHPILSSQLGTSKPVDHNFFSSSSSDEEQTIEKPERAAATITSTQSTAVERSVDSLVGDAESQEDMSKPKPVLKAFDANFSDRLSATLLRNSDKKAATGGDPPSTKYLDVVSSSSATAIEPNGRLTLPRAHTRHSSRSSVSSNEELGPSSVASRIVQIGNKIPVGMVPAKKMGPVEGDSNPTPAKVDTVTTTDGRPPMASRPATTAITMGRARGPTRRAPTNLGQMPSATVASTVDTSASKKSVSVPQTSTAFISPPKTKSIGSVVTDERPTTAARGSKESPGTTATAPLRSSAEAAKNPPIGATLTARVVVTPAKKTAKKTVFDSSTSDDDDFLAASRTSLTAGTTAKLSVVQSQAPKTVITTQQLQSQSTALAAGQINRTLTRKKGLFADSDSDT